MNKVYLLEGESKAAIPNGSSAAITDSLSSISATEER
jgi:hypothetical protein